MREQAFSKEEQEMQVGIEEVRKSGAKVRDLMVAGAGGEMVDILVDYDTNGWPEQFVKLVKLCLQDDARARPSFPEILSMLNSCPE